MCLNVDVIVFLCPMRFSEWQELTCYLLSLSPLCWVGLGWETHLIQTQQKAQTIILAVTPITTEA